MPESLRLYLDQMIQTKVADVLRQEGYNVIRASEIGQARADDSDIINMAISQNRILITLDEHFGDWAVLPINKHPGVVRVKVHPTTSMSILQLLLPFLKNITSDKIQNHLVIITQKREKWIHTALI